MLTKEKINSMRKKENESTERKSKLGILEAAKQRLDLDITDLKSEHEEILIQKEKELEKQKQHQKKEQEGNKERIKKHEEDIEKL